MATRHSEYQRQANDAYWTPSWCFEALHSVEQLNVVKEAAPREPHNYNFFATDTWVDDIATNPPFNRAEEFIRHGLRLTAPYAGKVAMLLPHAYDTAKGRLDLFQAAPFKCKLTLTRRIRWINLEQKKSGPSSNHGWFCWDWNYSGPPTMGWL
jgi:hypothetical protein